MSLILKHCCGSGSDILSMKRKKTLEWKLFGGIRHHDIVHVGRIALLDNALVLQAKRIALEEGLEFDLKQFNFSTKGLGQFKVANNITRISLRGEGVDADMDSVSMIASPGNYCPGYLESTMCPKSTTLIESAFYSVSWRVLETCAAQLKIGRAGSYPRIGLRLGCFKTRMDQIFGSPK
jgi:hypothetical protein